MRMLAGLIVAALAGFAPLLPAVAGLTPDMLGGVSAEGRVNALLPLSVPFTDDSGARRTLGAALGGRPAVLLFADYTCHTLCGPVLDIAVDGLEKSGLRPGIDYRLIVVGLDPKDGLAPARAMRTTHLDPASPVAAAASMLFGDDANIKTVTAAAGYRYAYDPEHDQFAHPAAAYVITPQGRIARVLSSLGLNGSDLRLALVDAGEGRIGTLVDHIRLLCYGFDPAQGIYTLSIERWLMAAAVLTVFVLAGWIAYLIRLARKEAA